MLLFFCNVSGFSLFLFWNAKVIDGILRKCFGLMIIAGDENEWDGIF